MAKIPLADLLNFAGACQEAVKWAEKFGTHYKRAWKSKSCLLDWRLWLLELVEPLMEDMNDDIMHYLRNKQARRFSNILSKAIPYRSLIRLGVLEELEIRYTRRIALEKNTDEQQVPQHGYGARP